MKAKKAKKNKTCRRTASLKAKKSLKKISLEVDNIFYCQKIEKFNKLKKLAKTIFFNCLSLSWELFLFGSFGLFFCLCSSQAKKYFIKKLFKFINKKFDLVNKCKKFALNWLESWFIF